MLILVWRTELSQLGNQRFDSVAGMPDRELGAFRCAPLSTPTPSRSTNSPPNQPPTKARTTAMNERASAVVLGTSAAPRRISQLPMKSKTTSTFTPPCKSPIRLALVWLGIENQSTRPKTAASKPPIIPDAINQ